MLFTSDYDRDCSHDEGIVRYRDGFYSNLIAEGDAVPGVPVSTFGAPSLIRVADDGTSVVQVRVSRDSTVQQQGVSEFIASETPVSLWQFSPSGEGRLMVVQGESVQTPDEQFFLTREEVDFRRLQWHENGFFSVIVRKDGEQYIFAGPVRDTLAYANFDSVGASSLEYVHSTLSPVPDYPASTYYTGLDSQAVLPDGRAVFMGETYDTSQTPRVDFLLHLNISPDNAETILLVGSSNPERVPIHDKLDRYGAVLHMADGSMLQHAREFGGSYYFLRFEMP